MNIDFIATVILENETVLHRKLVLSNKKPRLEPCMLLPKSVLFSNRDGFEQTA